MKVNPEQANNGDEGHRAMHKHLVDPLIRYDHGGRSCIKNVAKDNARAQNTKSRQNELHALGAEKMPIR